ncbi:MAG: prepilin peptidase [Selenomonas sp.]|nr:prepilin peptidase [Selenomonas sp.]
MYAAIMCLALVLALWASEWIDSLYQREREILTFPEKMRASAFRLPLLVLGFGGMAIILSGEAMQLTEAAKRLLLAWFLLMTMVTDFEQQLIFDRMQMPFAALALIFMCLSGQISNYLLAAVAGGGGFLLLALLTKGVIGGGDIKLIFVMGLWLGAEKLLQVIAGGFILSGLAAGVMLLSGRWGMQERFAYSPYFSLLALWEIVS